MRQNPEEKYQHSLSTGEMLPDPAQAEVMRRLTDLFQRIELSDSEKKGLFSGLTVWAAGFLQSHLYNLSEGYICGVVLVGVRP